MAHPSTGGMTPAAQQVQVDKWLSDEELKQAVNLQPDEVEFFRKLFEQVAGPGQPVLHGKTAVAFFSRSGLPYTTLKKIWELSDRNRKGHLTRAEFVLSARLVALAQVGMRATIEQLCTYKTRFPVPKFELPANIYTDDFDVTEAEKAIKHEYDADKCEWRRTLINVIIERAPFAEGAMRSAYHMRDLTASGEQSQFVAKLAKIQATAAEHYFDDVRMQTEAKKWANEFNKHKVPKPVAFVAAYVIELIDRPERPICGVERFVPGEYVKYNNNWDWSDDRRNTPQAFSHFTWEASGHTLLICDIQGVADMYTDPQIHSIDGKGYGQGNLGMRGICTFLDSHTCNHICNYLKLPAKRSKVVNSGTVIAPPAGGFGTRVPSVAGTRVGGDLNFTERIQDIRMGLQNQFQERFRQMEKKAGQIMVAKLDAQKQSLLRQHHQRQLAIEQQRELLETERRRLEEEKARWLNEERKKLGEQMDKQYEEERVRLSREAMGELLISTNQPHHGQQQGAPNQTPAAPPQAPGAANYKMPMLKKADSKKKADAATHGGRPDEGLTPSKSTRPKPPSHKAPLPGQQGHAQGQQQQQAVLLEQQVLQNNAQQQVLQQLQQHAQQLDFQQNHHQHQKLKLAQNQQQQVQQQLAHAAAAAAQASQQRKAFQSNGEAPNSQPAAGTPTRGGAKASGGAAGACAPLGTPREGTAAPGLPHKLSGSGAPQKPLPQIPPHRHKREEDAAAQRPQRAKPDAGGGKYSGGAAIPPRALPDADKHSGGGGAVSLLGSDFDRGGSILQDVAAMRGADVMVHNAGGGGGQFGHWVQFQNQTVMPTELPPDGKALQDTWGVGSSSGVLFDESGYVPYEHTPFEDLLRESSSSSEKHQAATSDAHKPNDGLIVFSVMPEGDAGAAAVQSSSGVGMNGELDGLDLGGWGKGHSGWGRGPAGGINVGSGMGVVHGGMAPEPIRGGLGMNGGAMRLMPVSSHSVGATPLKRGDENGRSSTPSGRHSSSETDKNPPDVEKLKNSLRDKAFMELDILRAK